MATVEFSGEDEVTLNNDGSVIGREYDSASLKFDCYACGEMKEIRYDLPVSLQGYECKSCGEVYDIHPTENMLTSEQLLDEKDRIDQRETVASIKRNTENTTSLRVATNPNLFKFSSIIILGSILLFLISFVNMLLTLGVSFVGISGILLIIGTLIPLVLNTYIRQTISDTELDVVDIKENRDVLKIPSPEDA